MSPWTTNAGRCLAFGLLSLLAGTLLFAAYAYQQLHRPLVLPAGASIYEVAPGTSLAAVTADLAEQGTVMVPAWLYRLYARLTQAEGSLKAGEFELRPGMNGRELLHLLRRGQVVQRQITFPEGWRFSEWRALLAQQPAIRQTTAGLQDSAVMALVSDAEINPEGQFFPDTYHYTKGESDLAILRRAHLRMTAALQLAWQHRADHTLGSAYEALILASIVEKETGFSPDRGKIAGVFVNRLRAGMRLQTDPTVIYGIDEFDGDLTRQHLRQPGAYNTYLNKGLPPTPICNPGQAAIDAVLNPQAVSYLYFVAKGDGHSYFSTTLAEHNQAVRRFQKRPQQGRAAASPASSASSSASGSASNSATSSAANNNKASASATGDAQQ